MASGTSKPSLPDGARSAAPGKQPAPQSNVSGKSGNVESAGGGSSFNAKTPVGHKKKHITTTVTYAPQIIQGRKYCGHALQRMQERGYTPTIVENVIQNGQRKMDVSNRMICRDEVNKLIVVLENDGMVVTIKGLK